MPNNNKPPNIPPGVTLLSDVNPKPIEWLWQNRIPLGEMTIFNGDPATNKSSLTLDIAARVSTGREMPDGSPGVEGGVVLIQAEDSIEKTVVLRAKAAGADLERIAVIKEVTIPDGLTMIELAVLAFGAKLVVIDPLMCFVSANANKEQAVRGALTPLGKLADRRNIAIILVRHLNKSGGRNSLYRGGGSIGITATVRSEFLLGNSPKDPNMRVLCHTKSNLECKAPSMLFEPVGVEGGVRVEWRGECKYRPEDLLVKPKSGGAQRENAIEFLLELLANGPMEVKTIRKIAFAAGFSLRTLERAKADLGILSERDGFGRGSKVSWALPEPESDEREGEADAQP